MMQHGRLEFRRLGLRVTLALVMIAALGPGLAFVRQTAAQDETPGGACGDPATMIHEVQGSEERTPLGGESVTVEGVVVGDYQDTLTQFGGFFVQEEDTDADGDPLTSEAVFVDSTLARVDVDAGDVVRVTGSAFELAESGSSLTQIRRVKAIVVCASGASVTPTVVMLPVEAVSDWERWEGMLVTVAQPLTVSELYDLGRYGQMLLSADGRLYQSTNVARPGDEALAVQADNDRRSIVLDDGNDQQNVDPIAYPAGGLGLENVLRSGYTVNGLTGVVDERYGAYRIHATGDVTFEPTEPRPVDPPDVGGRLRVASFNVLNYFNGDGAGGGFPTERGANTPAEFERQRAKIISAILDLDADVIGLIEIENDGDGPDSAVADLVGALNAAAGSELYAYSPDPEGAPLPGTGGDAIKQAIIYRPGAVTPVGVPVTTLAAPFDIRRPPVAQAFEEIRTGERFVFVVNHFKSKGCTGAGVDPDTGDGQGCWNQERIQAAGTLVDWLLTDPTGSGDPDVLVMGDLNAYAMEEPVMVFAEADYTNLLAQDDYSYIYYGQSGTLDHALANRTLADQVTGAAAWHINVDEARVFDYNVEYKTDNQVASLYDESPFRSSDHDPVRVGLALGGADAGDTEPDADDSGLDDATGGMLAIIGGLIAVLLAVVATFVGDRRRSRKGSG